MKLVLRVSFTGNDGGVFTMQKTVELPFAPWRDVAVDDAAWQEPRTIQKITVGTHGNYVPIIDMGLDGDANEDGMEAILDRYKAAGWHRPGQDIPF